MKATIIAITVLALFTTSGWTQEQIPVTISQRGHILVKAQINGVEGNFIFDTGAGLHVVSGLFYDKIKRQVKDSSNFTAFRHTGERLDGPTYKFDKITLGSLEQQNPWVGVYKGFDEMGFDGLISCKLIEDDLVTLDVRNKRIIVETKTSLTPKIKQTIPILIHSDRERTLDLFVTALVDSTYTAILEFDTGAGYSPLYLHSRYMNYTQTDSTRLERRQSRTGFGSSETTYLDKTKQVHISVSGTREQGYPNIVFKPSLIYDGLTSYIIFEDKPWTIDIKNRKLYLLE